MPKNLALGARVRAKVEPRLDVDGHRATLWGWTREIREVLAKTAVSLLRVREWDQGTLEPLAVLSDRLTTLYVECDLPSMRGVEALEQISHLATRGRVESIDFGKLKRLERLTAARLGPSGLGNVAAAPALRILEIDESALTDLRPLMGLVALQQLIVKETRIRTLWGAEGLTSLRRLVLQQVPLASLAGIEAMIGLEELALYLVPRLRSVAELKRLPRLRSLSLHRTRQVEDLASIGELAGLTELTLESVSLSAWESLSALSRLRRLDLTGVGRLPSLEWLGPLRSLEAFRVADADVKDGKLDVLLELPELREVSFADRRHYSHSRREIINILADRHTQGPGSFDNDAGRSWHSVLSATDLGAWAGTIRLALDAGKTGSIPALEAQRAIAAAEVMARMRGNWGGQTGSSAPTDAWVREHQCSVPDRYAAMAVEFVDRVSSPPSDLLDLWISRCEVDEWRATLAELRERLSA